jgi:tetratricopeptide (TPR) repeat protein
MYRGKAALLALQPPGNSLFFRFQRYRREQSDGRCGADLRDARRMVRTTLASSVIAAVLFTAISGWPGPVVAEDSDVCFRESGDVAIAACGRVIDSRKSTRANRIEAYASRGQEWYVKHDYDKAIADFDRAIGLNPKGLAEYGTGAILAYGNRGNAYDEKGDTKRAIQNYTMAIAIDPKYTASYTARGLQYEKLGDTEKARADFNAALGLPAKYQDGQWALDRARERLDALKAK